MRKLSKRTQDSLAKANGQAEEVISSISTTRAFAAEADEARRYEEGMSNYVSTMVSQAKVYFFYSSITFTFLPCEWTGVAQSWQLSLPLLHSCPFFSFC